MRPETSPNVAPEKEPEKPLAMKRFHSVRFRANIRFPVFDTATDWHVDDRTFRELHATDAASKTTIEVFRWTADRAQNHALCIQEAWARGYANVPSFAALRDGIAPPVGWTAVTDERVATPRTAANSAGNERWDGRIVVATEPLREERARGHVALVSASGRECLIAHATTETGASDAAGAYAILSERLAVLEASVARNIVLDAPQTDGPPR